MHPKSRLRRQLMIDKSVQMEVIARAILYFLVAFLYFTGVIFCTQWMSDPETPFFQHLIRFAGDAVLWAPALFLVAPLLVYDILRLTNRFVGPVYRIRTALQGLAEGEAGRPLKFRDDDYWTELCDPFNEVRRMLISSGAIIAPDEEEQMDREAIARALGAQLGEFESDPEARQPEADDEDQPEASATRGQAGDESAELVST